MFACVFVLLCVRQGIDALCLAWVTKMSVNTHGHQNIANSSFYDGRYTLYVDVL